MLRPLAAPHPSSHHIHCTCLQPPCVIWWEALWGRGISWGQLSEAEPLSPPAALLWPFRAFCILAALTPSQSPISQALLGSWTARGDSWVIS